MRPQINFDLTMFLNDDWEDEEPTLPGTRAIVRQCSHCAKQCDGYHETLLPEAL